MFIDQKRILDETDGGLKIILHYFPQAEKGLVRKGTKFKLRDGEKTASATLKLLSDGTYVVTDFGGDQKPKTVSIYVWRKKASTSRRPCSCWRSATASPKA